MTFQEHSKQIRKEKNRKRVIAWGMAVLEVAIVLFACYYMLDLFISSGNRFTEQQTELFNQILHYDNSVVLARLMFVILVPSVLIYYVFTRIVALFISNEKAERADYKRLKKKFERYKKYSKYDVLGGGDRVNNRTGGKGSEQSANAAL